MISWPPGKLRRGEEEGGQRSDFDSLIGRTVCSTPLKRWLAPKTTLCDNNALHAQPPLATIAKKGHITLWGMCVSVAAAAERDPIESSAFFFFFAVSTQRPNALGGACPFRTDGDLGKKKNSQDRLVVRARGTNKIGFGLVDLRIKPGRGSREGPEGGRGEEGRGGEVAVQTVQRGERFAARNSEFPSYCARKALPGRKQIFRSQALRISGPESAGRLISISERETDAFFFFFFLLLFFSIRVGYISLSLTLYPSLIIAFPLW